MWGFVSDYRFQGRAALALDAKGRVTVPARHRQVLVENAKGLMTITRHPGGWLMLFPRPEWDLFYERIVALPMSANAWRRIFLGHATDVEIDASSRVLVSPELRESVGLVRDVVLFGNGNHLELWDAQRHAQHEAALLQEPIPEAVQSLIV